MPIHCQIAYQNFPGSVYILAHPDKAYLAAEDRPECDRKESSPGPSESISVTYARDRSAYVVDIR